jgi:hypothetical protein
MSWTLSIRKQEFKKEKQMSELTWGNIQGNGRNAYKGKIPDAPIVAAVEEHGGLWFAQVCILRDTPPRWVYLKNSLGDHRIFPTMEEAMRAVEETLR